MRGKDALMGLELDFYKDHPRLCGEKCRQLDLWGTPEGSPPPMRGKVKKGVMKRTYLRITPAYAGKSALATAVADLPRDHPRLCGEKSSASSIWCSISGSPPPMRGKVRAYVLILLSCRITPAYAGKSI